MLVQLLQPLQDGQQRTRPPGLLRDDVVELILVSGPPPTVPPTVAIIAPCTNRPATPSGPGAG